MVHVVHVCWIRCETVPAGVSHRSVGFCRCCSVCEGRVGCWSITIKLFSWPRVLIAGTCLLVSSEGLIHSDIATCIVYLAVGGRLMLGGAGLYMAAPCVPITKPHKISTSLETDNNSISREFFC